MSVQYVILFACLYVVYRILVGDFNRWRLLRLERGWARWGQERRERDEKMRAEYEARHEAFMIVARAECEAQHRAWLASHGYQDEPQ